MTSQYSKNRQTAFQAQSGRCCYCGFLMWQDNPEVFATAHRILPAQAHHFQCTAEHLKARSEGGTNKASNIAAACKRCNQLRHRRKKAPSPQEYQEMVQKRLAQGKWHSIPPRSDLKRTKPCPLRA
ncbi:MAG TPA: restriction endonuclease [Pseudomonas sp.]|mgnify:FL=1|nr:restriction endonuclease [Pseudomonas sp.]HCL41213.1 restriction endonuclease [Pseudomonas sp.]